VVQAMTKICMEPSPTLNEPWNWSEELNNFIAVCLTRSVHDRPTAADLLQVLPSAHDTA
jgi:serine/threonine protein kinase